MTIFTPSEWMILALIFVLGLLIGMFMTAGGRRKWKTRYNDEHKRVDELERQHRDREKHWESRDKEWREQDSLRGAAARDDRRDNDRDGVPDDRDRRPDDDRRA